jgi:anaerobic ribonucleoside-triphosphate reductase
MADITLNITIPDNWVNRVKVVNHNMANVTFDFVLNNANIQLRYQEIQDGETEKQFAERIVRDIYKSFISLYELDKDYKERYIPAQQAIQTPNVDLPEDILT